MVIMGNLRLESDLQYYSHFQNNFKSWGNQLHHTTKQINTGLNGG